MSIPKQVTIIGCGLAGLTMAIVLHQQGLSFEVYEMREPSAAHAVGGAVSLCPNSLRLLDDLGMYTTLKDKAVQQTQGLILDEHLQIRNTSSWGDDQMYGYKALRIGRQELIEEMKAILRQKGAFANIHWRKKLVRIVADDESGIEFELEDGGRRRTDILIGADGVRSKVRHHIADVPATYSGYIMCLSNIPTSSLQLPPDLEEHRYAPTTVQCPTGGFNYVAQGPDGKDCFCLRQFRYPEQDTAGWRALRQDKTRLLEMLQQDSDSFPSLVQHAINAATEDGMDVWPIYTIPKLDNWTSRSSRVILIGDAAHAIPPAAGQGVNMAIEDAYSLGVLFASLKNGISLAAALSFWQSWRQERVEKVRRYAMQLSMARMSAEERARHAADIGEPPSGAQGQLMWLFAPEPGLRQQIESWASSQRADN